MPGIQISLGGSYIDPELLRHLEAVQRLQRQLTLEGYSGPQLRRLVSDRGAASIAQRPPCIEVQDAIVPGPWHDLPIRLYRRRGEPAGQRLMMYFHGGGWVTGSIATHDSLCAHIAEQTNYVVVSVEYRLAPEHPFPAANDDALAATLWMLDRRRKFGIADTADWAMGGDSAGAHMAISATMLMHQNGFPTCDRLLLFYPPVAPGLSTTSAKLYRNGPGLTAQSMNTFWASYAGAQQEPMARQRLDLRLWPELASLPPCVLMTAEHDILRDEGDDFARMLSSQGVSVRHLRGSGMIHGFARMLTASREARRHVDTACRHLMAIEAVSS